MTPIKSKGAALPKKKATKRKESDTFGQKEFHFSEVFYMPEGLENLFIAIYVITIPYVTGLIFLFFFAAKGKTEDFLQLDLAMFFVVWAIGYEIVGGLSLLAIFYKMFTFRKKGPQTPRVKERPKENPFRVHRFD